MKFKKISIVFLIILFIFLLSVNCFATSYSPYIEDLVTEEYPYYIIFQNPVTKKYFLVISKVQSTVWGDTDIVFSGLNVKNTMFYEYNDVSWQYIDKSHNFNISDYIDGFDWYTKYSTYPNDSHSLKVSFYIDGSNKAVKYCNYDIKNNGEDTIFFQQTPLMGYLKVRTVAKVMEEEELAKVLIQILAILSMILVVVVSFLGLRKAWKLLSTLFYQS